MEDSTGHRERERVPGSSRSGGEASGKRERDDYSEKDRYGKRDSRHDEGNESHRSRDADGGEKDRHRQRDERSHRREDESSRRYSRSRSRSPARRHPRHHRRRHEEDFEGSSSASGNESEEARRARRRRESRRRVEEEEDSNDERRRRRRKERERRETSEERADRKRRKREKKQSKKGHKSSAIMDYGKHGVINETDVNSRLTSEFRQWLVEERHINPETISRASERKEMASFIEDYNTATMPSDKYYNLEAHEKRMAAIRAGETVEDDLGGYDPLADEKAAKASYKAQRRAEESNRGTPAQWQSREQLEALHRVQTERIEAAKMKQLGLQTSATKGVRMDGTEFDRR